MMTPDPSAIATILAADPVWAVYALADLQPAFAAFSHWQTGRSADGEGVLLLFTALQPPILFTMGPTSAVAAALQETELPAEMYLTVPEAHLGLLTQRYRVAQGLHPMWRMVRRRPEPAVMPNLPGLVRLTPADCGAIRQLYAYGGPFTPDAFDPYQLDDGIFFGVKDEDGALLAVGGTHIIDRQHSAVAIGNMYTHPQQRGRGYAGAVLAAIVHTVQQEQIKTIALNVDQQNSTARHIYQKHGFAIHLAYIEGIVRSH